MRLAIVFIFFCLASVWMRADDAPTLSKEECRIIVSDFERLSNLNPGQVEDEAPEVLARLQRGETLTSYFVAYNIYVENLFNEGELKKSALEIEKMLNEALEQTDRECKVIALRTQGQFYYKLGIYDRAAECFRSAMEICPRYDSDQLEHCFTWSSTLFWLVQTDIRTGHIKEAEHWIGQMDDMMKWLDSRGEVDRVGYKPVMIRGLKAKIALQKGDTAGAERLIAECPQFMQDSIPMRAYVEYYIADMQLCVHQGRHAEALSLLDKLIEIHIENYKPIAAEYLHQKGKSLAELGRYRESAETLSEYIDLKETVDRLALAQQLDEWSTRFEVEKFQHERDNIRRQLLIVVAICVALAIIIITIIISQRILRRKNRTVARNISELNRLTRETSIPAANTDTADDAPANEELMEIGKQIVDFITTSRCYLRPDCSRDTIKEGIGVGEHTLAKAIVAATGMSFVNYINHLRLKVSIEMLEDKPEMAINDISTACGFGSVRQFQRNFKQQYDLSPSAYREARRPSTD